MRRKISLFLFAFSLMLPGLEAQTTLTISGIVSEKGTGNPISGAEVSIVGGRANQDVTDSTGKFSLTLTPDVRPGTRIRIRVVKEGYEPWTDNIAASSEIPLPISLKKLPKANPRRPDEKEKQDSPSEKQQPMVIVQAPYGNLARRCQDLGDGILFFVKQRNETKPDSGSHREDYWQWYRVNDGFFHGAFYDDVKVLQKDLAAVNVKDRRLDELIARHEQYYAERNRQPVQTVIDHSFMFHLSVDEINEIGQRFTFLATQIPSTVVAIPLQENRPQIGVYVSDHLWQATELKYNSKQEMQQALSRVINLQPPNHYEIGQVQNFTPLNITVRTVGSVPLRHGKATVMANISVGPITAGAHIFDPYQFNYDLTDPLHSFNEKPFEENVFTIQVPTKDQRTVLILQINITGDGLDAYSAAANILFEKIPRSQ